MKSILTVITAASLFAGVSVRADSIHGFIQKNGTARSLRVANKNATETILTMTAANPTIQASIDMLKNGDYLVARGTSNSSSVQVDAIESLGLQALVGKWSTSRDEVYDFRDFTSLNLYVPSETANGEKGEVVKAGEFQYSVAPDQGARYSIFLSNAASVTVGSIEFHNRQLILNVIDPTTGQVSADILLSPLATVLDSK